MLWSGHSERIAKAESERALAEKTLHDEARRDSAEIAARSLDTEAIEHDNRS